MIMWTSNQSINKTSQRVREEEKEKGSKGEGEEREERRNEGKGRKTEEERQAGSILKPIRTLASRKIIIIDIQV